LVLSALRVYSKVKTEKKYYQIILIILKTPATK